LYIVYKFGDIRFSNFTDYEGRNCNFLDDSQKLLALGPNISESTELIETKFSHLVGLWSRMRNLTSVLRLSKGRCYGNQLIFGAKNIVDLQHHHSLHWRLKLNWNIATSIHALTAAIMPLHRVKIWQTSVQ